MSRSTYWISWKLIWIVSVGVTGEFDTDARQSDCWLQSLTSVLVDAILMLRLGLIRFKCLFSPPIPAPYFFLINLGLNYNGMLLIKNQMGQKVDLSSCQLELRCILYFIEWRTSWGLKIQIYLSRWFSLSGYQSYQELTVEPYTNVLTLFSNHSRHSTIFGLKF